MHIPAWVPFIGPFLDRRRAWRELPDLARRWGMRFIASEMRYSFGSIDGTLQGYPVMIQPDSPMVTVKFNREIEDFQLMTLDTGEKRHKYDLGHPKFERTFATMELNQRLASALCGRADVLDRVLALLRHRVVGMHLSNQGLICTMHNPFRRPWGRNIESANYITVRDLERLLPEMIETVRLLESVLSPENSVAGKVPSPQKDD